MACQRDQHLSFGIELERNDRWRIQQPAGAKQRVIDDPGRSGFGDDARDGVGGPFQAGARRWDRLDLDLKAFGVKNDGDGVDPEDRNAGKAHDVDHSDLGT